MGSLGASIVGVGGFAVLLGAGIGLRGPLVERPLAGEVRTVIERTGIDGVDVRIDGRDVLLARHEAAPVATAASADAGAASTVADRVDDALGTRAATAATGPSDDELDSLAVLVGGIEGVRSVRVARPAPPPAPDVTAPPGGGLGDVLDLSSDGPATGGTTTTAAGASGTTTSTTTGTDPTATSTTVAATPAPTAAPGAPLTLTATITAGHVALRGTVPGELERTVVAGSAVARVGYDGVSQEVALGAAGDRRLDVGAFGDLAGGLAVAGITDGTVAYADGLLRLQGTVPSQAVKDAAAATAAKVAEGGTVDDQLVVRTPAEPVKIDGAVGLENVYFATGSAALDATAELAVDRVTALLAAEPTRRVVATGHTDNRGAADLNQRLSQQRADAVRAALVARGVDAARIDLAARADADPLASNDDAAGRAKNRRVSFTLL